MLLMPFIDVSDFMQAQIQKECGDDNTCIPNLTLISFRYALLMQIKMHEIFKHEQFAGTWAGLA